MQMIKRSLHDKAGELNVHMFATTGLQGQTSLRAWNDFHERTFPGLRISGKNDEFHGQVQSLSIGNLTLIRPQSAASVVQRHLDNSRFNGGGHLVFHLMQSGQCNLLHRNQTAQIRAGDMGMCLSEEFYSLDIPMAHDCLIVDMPVERMQAKIPHIRDLAGVRLGREAPSMRMLRAFLANLWDELERGMPDDHAAPYGEVIVDVMAQALRDQNALPIRADHDVFDQMMAAVLSRYNDDSFTPANMAAELGVSLRTLQMAAARHGTTPSRMVNKQRMVAAARALKGPSDCSITDIAFDVGFNDSAYFSRRFQEYFGVSPSHYRKAH